MFKIVLSHANMTDLPAMQSLFVETVTSICSKDYTPDQIKVWTASIENAQRWIDVIDQQYVQIAWIDNQMVGFGSLDKGNYIDFMYVHKDYQGQGVAHAIYTALEQEAIRQGSKSITSDVSFTARPFFEKKGFVILQKQTFVRQRVEISNFKMEKIL
ncbi:MAG: GNAT family N-acetyltransferase [Raineya sp.]|jgi:putative acetyltransferase|nr:GNAT family N-acetyltransferase [Raineya sp.]